MNKQEHIDYWIRTSEMDISSMETIHSAGKYTIALFMGHLALEKLLKAFWVKTHSDNFPPKIIIWLKLRMKQLLNLVKMKSLFYLK